MAPMTETTKGLTDDADDDEGIQNGVQYNQTHQEIKGTFQQLSQHSYEV